MANTPSRHGAKSKGSAAICRLPGRFLHPNFQFHPERHHRHYLLLGINGAAVAGSGNRHLDGLLGRTISSAAIMFSPWILHHHGNQSREERAVARRLTGAVEEAPAP
jgi:hypothetical protein